jgi:hypothetical protein
MNILSRFLSGRKNKTVKKTCSIALRLEIISAAIDSLNTAKDSFRISKLLEQLESRFLTNLAKLEVEEHTVLLRLTGIRMKHFLKVHQILKNNILEKPKQDFFSCPIPKAIQLSIFRYILEFRGHNRYFPFIKTAISYLYSIPHSFSSSHLEIILNSAKLEGWKQLVLLRLLSLQGFLPSEDLLIKLASSQTTPQLKAYRYFKVLTQKSVKDFDNIIMLSSFKTFSILSQEAVYLEPKQALEICKKLSKSRHFKMRQLICKIAAHHTNYDMFRLLMDNLTKDVSQTVKENALEVVANQYTELLKLELCNIKTHQNIARQIVNFRKSSNKSKKLREQFLIKQQIKRVGIHTTAYDKLKHSA